MKPDLRFQVSGVIGQNTEDRGQMADDLYLGFGISNYGLKRRLRNKNALSMVDGRLSQLSNKVDVV